MEEAIQMKEKTALITGGASGLGKELALMLMHEGYSVIVIDKIKQDDLFMDYKNKLKKYVTIELSDLEAVKSYIGNDSIKESNEIDILIINAFPRVFKNLQFFKDQEIIDFVNSAFTSQVVLVNHYLNKMIKNGFGRIIIISSISAFQGYSSGSLYCSLKSAWLTFHQSVEKELLNLKKNITITTICPDSFSDQLGNKYRQYDYVTRGIKKTILKSISQNRSDTYYQATLWKKIILSLLFFRKMLKIW